MHLSTFTMNQETENMKLICDSGSTKSAWCLTDGTSPLFYTTQGINPFQQSEEKIHSILNDELLPNLPKEVAIDEVYFYGAGCTKEKSPIVAEAIKNVIAPNAVITVDSDMFGAAIALCGNESGIVSILGTGSNSAYFDGKELHSAIPALGYILGDEGSGAYIGKRLVGDVLKKQFSEDICQLFLKETGETQASIIQKVYREPMANRYLASLSIFCARHKDKAEVKAFICDCFCQFFERNIIPMNKIIQADTKVVNCVGSIAYYYKEEIEEVASRYGFKIGKILQAPIEGLVEYLG